MNVVYVCMYECMLYTVVHMCYTYLPEGTYIIYYMTFYTLYAFILQYSHL